MSQFTVDDGRQGFGKKRHERQIVRLGGELGSTGKEKISRQHGCGGRPAGVQSGHAAAQKGAIDQIIMDQGGGMEQFHRSAKRDQFFFGRAKHIPNEQAQRRPDTLATGG